VNANHVASGFVHEVKQNGRTKHVCGWYDVTVVIDNRDKSNEVDRLCVEITAIIVWRIEEIYDIMLLEHWNDSHIY
jgi:hypothetical protein